MVTASLACASIVESVYLSTRYELSNRPGKRPSKRPSKTNAIIKKSKIMLAVPERRGKNLSALEDELGLVVAAL